jgi:hypothetical protein
VQSRKSRRRADAATEADAGKVGNWTGAKRPVMRIEIHGRDRSETAKSEIGGGKFLCQS